MLLGAIADDLTGASDLALTLSRGGMRTIQLIGTSATTRALEGADAVVIALKSRTIAAAEAAEQSLTAARMLLRSGARQLFFKYCSTFDSTDSGNIGPVTEALMSLTGEPLTVACPAFPTNGRTVYQGHLFVGDQLLSDSPMRDHPLTPMRDSNLVRVLRRQTNLDVGSIPLTTVAQGSRSIAAALSGRRGILIVDAISDGDLRAIAAASSALKLITGGSGMAIGVPDNFRRAGLLAERPAPARLDAVPGRTVIIAGSCSAQTRHQIRHLLRLNWPAIHLDPMAIVQGSATLESVRRQILSLPGDAVPVVYSSAEPDAVRQIQDRLGRERAGSIVEEFLGTLARGLLVEGFTRFIVAGGETSGAVVAALGVRAFEIGPEIDAGVPWVLACDGEPRLVMALKSGNFGTEDFFVKACRQLP